MLDLRVRCDGRGLPIGPAARPAQGQKHLANRALSNYSPASPAVSLSAHSHHAVLVDVRRAPSAPSPPPVPQGSGRQATAGGCDDLPVRLSPLLRVFVAMGKCQPFLPCPRHRNTGSLASGDGTARFCPWRPRSSRRLRRKYSYEPVRAAGVLSAASSNIISTSPGGHRLNTARGRRQAAKSVAKELRGHRVKRPHSWGQRARPEGAPAGRRRSHPVIPKPMCP